MVGALTSAQYLLLAWTNVLTHLSVDHGKTTLVDQLLRQSGTIKTALAY